MDRHQQRKVIILLTQHLINTVGVRKTDAYKKASVTDLFRKCKLNRQHCVIRFAQKINIMTTFQQQYHIHRYTFHKHGEVELDMRGSYIYI